MIRGCSLIAFVRAAVAILTLHVTLAGASGQSLADVARKEQERRQKLKATSKVYTNDDLRPYPKPAAAPADTTDSSKEKPAAQTEEPKGAQAAERKPAAPAAEPQGVEDEKDEAHWRGRIEAARAQLQRNQIFADALQSRINALTADFVNRDDPAQRAVVAVDRQKALTELERVSTEIQRLTQEIAAIEEEARRAGVPPGWVR